MRSSSRWVMWAVLVTVALAGLFTLWQWLGNENSEVNEDERPLLLWSFESARLSTDGSTIEIDALLAPDETCWEYDHVETEVVDGELVVSLYYLGPGPEQLCQIPCPGGTTTDVVNLESPVDPSLVVVKNPETAPHCSELIPS